MGAVTALLYASTNPEGIIGLCLDSPFSDLRKVVEDVIISYNVTTDLI